MLGSVWWVLPVACLLTAGLCLALVPVATRLGLVDHPGVRKVHETVTPLTGGAALLISLSLVGAWWLTADRFVQALFAGGVLMFGVGLVDDRKGLTAAVRFLVQVIACAIMMAWADVRLNDFGPLFTPSVLELGLLSAPVTIFAALGVINSFNLIDGMDGLGGSIFIVAALGMALFAALASQFQMLWPLLLCSAAVFGFLLLNARFPWNLRARVFHGHSG